MKVSFKKVLRLLLGLSLICKMTTTVFAVGFVVDRNNQLKIKYYYDDTNYYKNGYYYIDDDNDGLYEYYYFTASGNVYINTKNLGDNVVMTNQRGQILRNGRVYQLTESQINKLKNQNAQEETKKRGPYGHAVPGAEYHAEWKEKFSVIVSEMGGEGGSGGGANGNGASDAGNGGEGNSSGGTGGNAAGIGTGGGVSTAQGLGSGNSGNGNSIGSGVGSGGNSGSSGSGTGTGGSGDSALRDLREMIAESRQAYQRERAESIARELETAKNKQKALESIEQSESIAESESRKAAQESIKVEFYGETTKSNEIIAPETVAREEYEENSEMPTKPNKETVKYEEIYQGPPATKPTVKETTVKETIKYDDLDVTNINNAVIGSRVVETVVPLEEQSRETNETTIVVNPRAIETKKFQYETEEQITPTAAIRETMETEREREIVEPEIIEHEIMYETPPQFFEEEKVIEENEQEFFEEPFFEPEPEEMIKEENVVNDDETVVKDEDVMVHMDDEDGKGGDEGGGLKGGNKTSDMQDNQGNDSINESKGDARDNGMFQASNTGVNKGVKIFEIERVGSIGPGTYSGSVNWTNILILLVLSLLLVIGFVSEYYYIYLLNKNKKGNYLV